MGQDASGARACQSARNFDPRPASNIDPTLARIFRRPRPEQRSEAE